MVKFRDLKKSAVVLRNDSPVKRRSSERKISISEVRRPQRNEKPTVREIEESRKVLYDQASDYLAGVLELVRDKKPFSLEPGIAIIEKIVDLKGPLDALFLKAIHSDDSYDFVINHSVNVAIYAINMADTLGFSQERQVEIGMVGLFHDLGMARIPEELYYKEKLTDDELKLFKRRPHFSFKILSAFADEHGYLADCAHQVYERIDGTGYPRRLQHDEIHEYAQIVGLVDVYEALIHNRPQRAKMLHFYAVKEIIRTGKHKFQQRYMKALLNTFSIFPIHSYVRLNSNAIGRVIQTYDDQPMRPKLKIIYDSQKQRVLTDRIIDLPEHSLLYITDAVSEEELLEISEESYLVSKPQTEKDPESGQDGDAPADSAKTVKRKIEKSRSSAKGKSPGGKSKLPVVLLVIAALFLISGLAWYFLAGQTYIEPVEKTVAPAPTAATQTRTVVAERDVASKPETTAPVAKTEEKEPPAAATSSTTDQDTSPEPGSNTPAATNADQSSDQAPMPSTPADTTEAVQEEPPIEKAEVSIDNGNETSSGFLDIAPREGRYPYSIKLTYFKTSEEAQTSVIGFREAGIDAYWVKVDLGDQGIWYRVFAGHFPSTKDAQTYVDQHNLKGTAIKETDYTTWIGACDTPHMLEQKLSEIGDKGFSPYAIEQPEGIYHIYVGAFYTKTGAQEQSADLSAAGIDNRIVKR